MYKHKEAEETTFIGSAGSFELSPTETLALQKRQVDTTEGMSVAAQKTLVDLWREQMGLESIPIPYHLNALANTIIDGNDKVSGYSKNQELFKLRHAQPYVEILNPPDSTIVFSFSGAGSREIVLADNTLYMRVRAGEIGVFVSFDGLPDIPTGDITIQSSKTVLMLEDGGLYYVPGKRSIYVGTTAATKGCIECWTMIR